MKYDNVFWVLMMLLFFGSLIYFGYTEMRDSVHNQVPCRDYAGNVVVGSDCISVEPACGLTVFGLVCFVLGFGFVFSFIKLLRVNY